MSAIDELWRRADFILRGQPVLRVHVDCAVGTSAGTIDGKPCRLGWFVNFNENYKHAFIMTPWFGEECPSVLQNRSLVDELNKLLNGVEITFGNANPVMHDPGSLESCVFMSKVYIFTDILQRPREFIREMFRKHNLEAVDNERWEMQWGRAKPDAFICHDHRDKAEFGDPLYDQLARMPLKIFYDKYSIRIGDDLVEKIEKGLAECEFAIILVSKRFLENKAWASHEMRALINRQIAEGREKLILPVWIDVDSAEVRAKSPMLGKINAARFRDGVEKLAREINSVVMSDR